mmetsp:Transcript_30514/g.74104  ORF Transcript_30514/g.74104 Transcript_30514/m.74104 type:complete len:843 (+) Transcript_30514:326-2854(+)
MQPMTMKMTTMVIMSKKAASLNSWTTTMATVVTGAVPSGKCKTLATTRSSLRCRHQVSTTCAGTRTIRIKTSSLTVSSGGRKVHSSSSSSSSSNSSIGIIGRRWYHAQGKTTRTRLHTGSTRQRSWSSVIYSPSQQRTYVDKCYSRLFYSTASPITTTTTTTVTRNVLLLFGSGAWTATFAVYIGLYGGGLAEPVSSDCEEMSTTPIIGLVEDESPADSSQVQVRVRMNDSDTDEESFWHKLGRLLRAIRRVLKLTFVFSPVVALYPLYWIAKNRRRRQQRHLSFLKNNDGEKKTGLDAQQIALRFLDDDADNGDEDDDSKLPPGFVGWYYRLCLRCVEYSGAACIKIMQWAGSRPDMFGPDFCAVFSQLQDDTTPHSWHHTQQALIDTFGPEWQNIIQIGPLLGSGCIAQVHKGYVLVDENEDDVEYFHDSVEDRVKDDTNRGPQQRPLLARRMKPVAIKVMHPNVEDDIDADLDILRISVRLLEQLNVVENLKWLNLPGFIEEMATMLKIQLDLRQEGLHLRQFNINFKDNETIVFPQLVEHYPPSKHVLIETFCDGVPIMEWIKYHKKDPHLLSKMCVDAIKAVCQMVFLDNFTHGDLHPGNVLVTKDYKLVLLDVGIVTEHSESDHRLISDVLAAFIRCDGRRAGQLMMADSNERLRTTVSSSNSTKTSGGDHSRDEELFLNKIEWLTVKAAGKDYFMEHLGTYITYIANAAAAHHVMLNQAFISSALAVKVQEGIALALDPSIEIWKVAIPIILESERRHGRTTQRAAELTGLQSLLEWVTGGESKSGRERRLIEAKKRRIIEQGLGDDSLEPEQLLEKEAAIAEAEMNKARRNNTT